MCYMLLEGTRLTVYSSSSEYYTRIQSNALWQQYLSAVFQKNDTVNNFYICLATSVWPSIVQWVQYSVCAMDSPTHSPVLGWSTHTSSSSSAISSTNPNLTWIPDGGWGKALPAYMQRDSNRNKSEIHMQLSYIVLWAFNFLSYLYFTTL